MYSWTHPSCTTSESATVGAEHARTQIHPPESGVKDRERGKVGKAETDVSRRTSTSKVETGKVLIRIVDVEYACGRNNMHKNWIKACEEFC